MNKKLYEPLTLKQHINEFTSQYDPILVSLVRKFMVNQLNDLCNVQPMAGPTGLIFTMKSHYNDDPNTLKGLIEKYCAENFITTESDG